MKILFLLGATSRIRNFKHAIVDLADRGHVLQLAGRPRAGLFELKRSVEHQRITGRVNPTERSDAWRDAVDLLRGARDYVRYFDPRYAQATRLVRRAYEIAPTEFVLFCERHPWIKRHWKLAAAALALCEDLIPVDARFEEFLREERPDLVLVTPLVTFESYQTDYVKAARTLGIPVVFIPFSWDNLTNKGLMRVQPDRVLVWNDTQLREAIELHGCPAERIAITGAARFDDFFNRQVTTTRAEFCAAYGLDPQRPVVLYLGSSQLTGPNEMELIRRWVESLRAAADPLIKGCGILIRPHPALRTSWASVDLSAVENAALSLDASRGGDQDLFDSLFHAHTAVGLNTSAMLEAAIVGRPVHTLMIAGFDEGQVGTMHFHYLVEAYGGLATVARNFEEHQRQLSVALQGAPQQSPRSERFAQQFLRPLGRTRAVSPILADEIERAGSLAVAPARVARWWHAPLRRLLLAWLRRRRTVSLAGEDTSVIATSQSLRPVRTALQEIQHSTTPVFVGPWNDSCGNELLYWIPFVRWAANAYGIPRERLIIVTRSGLRTWYGSLAQRFIEATSLFSAAELGYWMERTVPQREQDYKQVAMSPFDHEVIERAARAFELSDYSVLHPFTLFRVLSRLQKDAALPQMADVLRAEPFDRTTGAELNGLPRGFVAMSVAFTEALPDSDENRAFLAKLVAETAEDHDVVLLDGPPPTVTIPRTPRVHLLQDFGGASTAELQTRALAKAGAFVGSHGDLAVLASFCGTPAISYHDTKLPADEAGRLEAMSATAGWGKVTIERARRYKGIRLPARISA